MAMGTKAKDTQILNKLPYAVLSNSQGEIA